MASSGCASLAKTLRPNFRFLFFSPPFGNIEKTRQRAVDKRDGREEVTGRRLLTLISDGQVYESGDAISPRPIADQFSLVGPIHPAMAGG